MTVIFGKAYVYYNDIMYYVKRIIHSSHNPVVDTWREHLMCDIVLKKEDNYYFCQKVIEAEVIDDQV